ncbi:hypothetical protein LOC68_13280 [Blastopirellula sp. JC732]|uniref:Uncharacterized protein n=1 Tax=Blastopirellula sediminis TaxID=2894196 RepID=A0A9X1SGH2_9BACT|nr:hypothetical protein [Blastopirellula sediminis]MCC9607339.1 hypothetical protein [Blastopirellula sediminis]MCC9629368.1 hypothetical protein [Blastopirellula sediminis]
MIRVNRSKGSRICQGDIFRDVDLIESVHESNGRLKISKIAFPLAIVLTQDCDLAQDYTDRFSRRQVSNQDKRLFSVLVAPLYNIEHFYNGEHLSELGMKMQTVNKKKTQGDFLHNNQTPRYHYLKFGDDVPIVDSVIDFKHYFSVSVEYLKKKKNGKDWVCKVSDLFREDICQRFAAFLSRIGLPDPPRPKLEKK